MTEGHEHKHWGCPECQHLVHKEVEATRDERSIRRHEELKAISTRTAVALELIADHLGAVMGTNDLGEAAVRIVGELVGGEGDVREPA